MNIPYPKERWEQVPERIRELDSTELDFTDHDERELHKLEMSRRLWISSNFLKKYTWSGNVHPSYREDVEDKEKARTEPQSNLEAFVQNV